MAMPEASIEDAGLLAAARGGDEAAFAELVAPCRRALLAHCYRMLGSPQDAEDALQDTLLRAWRHLASYEPRASLQAWLYRIATNVCLTQLGRRPATGRAAGAASRLVEPLPDRLLDEAGAGDPAVVIERRETVELAFAAAVQLLPPRQRAVLLLRDVLEWRAGDVAGLLGTTPAAVNSALQRARQTLAAERAGGGLARTHEPAPAADEEALARRFADAWHRDDLDGLLALMTGDVLLTMPPQPLRVEGTPAVGAFLRDIVAGGHLDRFRLLPARANRQPAVAMYRAGDGGRVVAYSVLVLSLRTGLVASIVRFAAPELVAEFGLPRELPGGRAGG